jgi:hypothetical protein
MGFSYCQAIGELIFAMTVKRIDISYPIIKLSQYSAQPSKVHYQAVKDIFVYLYAPICAQTACMEPNTNLPYFKPTIPISAPSTIKGFSKTQDANILHGYYVDSDWGLWPPAPETHLRLGIYTYIVLTIRIEVFLLFSSFFFLLPKKLIPHCDLLPVTDNPWWALFEK